MPVLKITNLLQPRWQVQHCGKNGTLNCPRFTVNEGKFLRVYLTNFFLLFAIQDLCLQKLISTA